MRVKIIYSNIGLVSARFFLCVAAPLAGLRLTGCGGATSTAAIAAGVACGGASGSTTGSSSILCG